MGLAGAGALEIDMPRADKRLRVILEIPLIPKRGTHFPKRGAGPDLPVNVPEPERAFVMLDQVKVGGGSEIFTR